jgi:hypothetical protein
MTYAHKGKQYVAVLSGVGGWAGVGLTAGSPIRRRAPIHAKSMPHYRSIPRSADSSRFLLCHDNPGKPAFLWAGLVAQEEAGELKDAIIYFERNAWLLKKLWYKLSEFRALSCL